MAGLGQHRSRAKASVLMTRGLPPLPSPAWPGRTNHPAPLLPPLTGPPEEAAPQSCAHSSFSVNLAGSRPRPPRHLPAPRPLPQSLLLPVHPQAHVAVKQDRPCARDLCKRRKKQNEKLGSKNKTKTTVKSARAERAGRGALGRRTAWTQTQPATVGQGSGRQGRRCHRRLRCHCPQWECRPPCFSGRRGSGLSFLGNSRSPAGLGAPVLSGFLSGSGGRAETRAPGALARHVGRQPRRLPVCPLRGHKSHNPWQRGSWRA